MLGCAHEFFKTWIKSQITEVMTLDNFGSIYLVFQTLPFSFFTFLDEEQKRHKLTGVN